MAPLIRRLATLLVPLAPTGGEYSERAGLKLAYLERAVYCGAERFGLWDVGDARVHGPAVKMTGSRPEVAFVHDDRTNAAAGVGRLADPDGCFVAVRGTIGPIESLLDAMFWLTDFGRASCHRCEVDAGFKADYESIRPAVFAALQRLGCAARSLHLVGHSLGAAVLTYLLYDALDAGYRVAHMYAMETPRPGNERFAVELQSKLAGVDAWRITHYRDVVVHLPPTVPLPYAHALPEIYYTSRNGSDYEVCGVDTSACSGRWWPWQYSTQDHSWYAQMRPDACSPAAGLRGAALTTSLWYAPVARPRRARGENPT